MAQTKRRGTQREGGKNKGNNFKGKYLHGTIVRHHVYAHKTKCEKGYWRYQSKGRITLWEGLHTRTDESAKNCRLMGNLFIPVQVGRRRHVMENKIRLSARMHWRTVWNWNLDDAI